MTVSKQPSKDNSEIIFDYLQSVMDVTSRIDERVKILIENNKNLKEEIDKVNESYRQVISKVVILEERDVKNIILDCVVIKEKINLLQLEQKKLAELSSDISVLQQKLKVIDNFWIKIFDSVWKLMLTIIAGYILYKLGFQAPP